MRSMALSRFGEGRKTAAAFFETQAACISKRLVVVGILGILTIYYIIIYSESGFGYLGLHFDNSSKPGHLVGDDGWLSMDDFVAMTLDNDMYIGRYDGNPVRKLCREANWRDDLVMSCDRMAGGIGNMKTNVLACMRYAIESGAKLITPKMHLRTTFDLMAQSFDYENGTDLNYMFDTDHLYRTLANDCPQLQIVAENDTSIIVPAKNDAMPVDPKKLLPDPIEGHVLKDPSQFRPALDAAIQQYVAEHKLEPSRTHPLRLSYNDNVIFSWPTRYDSDGFRANWGRLVQLPHHLRMLSARILYRLYRALDAKDQDPARPSNNTFMGAHLRYENDAVVVGWTSWEMQAAHLREGLIESGLRSMYLASGTLSDAGRLQKFLKDAAEDPDPTLAQTRIFQKWDLLDDKDRALAESLTWDQIALVDINVMLRASQFSGTWESSWSWHIVLTRHTWAKEYPYNYEANPVTFKDELSTLWGNPGNQGIIDPCFWV